MNRVIQINIVQADNGFVVQSPSGDQMVAQDEAGVQDAVKTLVAKLLNQPEADRYGKQTIKKFGQAQESA